MKEVKKIRKQTNIKKDNFKSIPNAKFMVPLLLLTFLFVFSCAINDVAATQETSNNTIVPSNNLTTSNSGEGDSQTTDQSVSNTSNTNNSPNPLNSETNQSVKDPQIYNGGVPVARGTHPAGYIYPTILEALPML